MTRTPSGRTSSSSSPRSAAPSIFLRGSPACRTTLRQTLRGELPQHVSIGAVLFVAAALTSAVAGQARFVQYLWCDCPILINCWACRNRHNVQFVPVWTPDNELLLWLIRTSAARADTWDALAAQTGVPAGHQDTGMRAPQVALAGEASAPVSAGLASATVDHAIGPDRAEADHADRSTDRGAGGWPAPEGFCRTGRDEDEVNLAAVAAYRASLEDGKPLSERGLAAMYGKTSRCWARNRMAEAGVLRP